MFIFRHPASLRNNSKIIPHNKISIKMVCFSRFAMTENDAYHRRERSDIALHFRFLPDSLPIRNTVWRSGRETQFETVNGSMIQF